MFDQTRRQFIGRSSGAAVTVLLPPALAATTAEAKVRPFRSGKFAEGIVSGDPSPRGINLWTRLDPAGSGGKGTVELEIATDKDFRKVVTRKQIGTSASSGHAVKAAVTGLKPHEEYYYRFATRTSSSQVGRFRTTPPAGSKEPVKFAFFSCQEYSHGWYNAHQVLAKGDYDFVVCLGDYIYSETYTSTATGNGVRNDKIGRVNPNNSSIVREAITLADYRDKYALNLKREFPRVPLYGSLRADFWRWADWGRELMELHIGYEAVEPWPLARTDTPDDKARAAGQAPRCILKSEPEAGRIVIDSETVLAGVPHEAWGYRLGNRCAIDWVLDQHKEKKPRDPTIREKFDTYRFADHKQRVIDLLARVVRVSVETLRVVHELKAAPR